MNTSRQMMLEFHSNNNIFFFTSTYTGMTMYDEIYQEIIFMINATKYWATKVIT